MDLIQSINRSHGLETMGDRPADDPIVILRGKLERACDRLSRDLYNTKTHFLLEFIQNADDNNYDSRVIPTLQLRLERRRMTIRCNELGFAASNVKAICDIGGSTKTEVNLVQGYIGEKGIGFKAVFVVATKVYVASNLYTFRFDRDGPLGMINPIWDDTYAVKPNWTTFRLDIAEEEHTGMLSEQLCELRPSLLLFLRKLRSVDLHVAADRDHPARAIKISRSDPTPGIVELERSEDGASSVKRKYIIVKRTTPTDPAEPKREGIERSEVVLAFPMTAQEKPLDEDQYIHAFLPMSQYGFTFVIHADFLTTSSRESILADSIWNQQLFVGISDAFVDAVQQFQEHPVLKDVWIRFIPMQIKDPFCKVADRIITLLKHCNVLRASDGTLSRPELLIIPPRHFRDDEKKPLIPSQHLPKGLRYLSDSYDMHGDSVFLTRLGVCTMSDQDFLNGLKRMGTAIGSQSDRWQETVCRCLQRIPKTKNGRFRPEILDLEILPLSDGSWAVAKTAHRHVFVTNLDGFDELMLSSIKEGIEEGSYRHQFYAALGVKRAEPALIAERILQIRSQVSAETLVRYARFFYEHRKLRDLPCPADLQVVDEQGLWASGKELYLDVPDSKGTERTPLRTILPRTARFLHPAYTETYHDRYWVLWLQDSLRINTAPRLVSGKLSPEFQTMARSMDTSKFLLVLLEYWPQLSRGISQEGKSQLSQTEVKCEDGRHLLGTTALKRSALQRMPSSYLHFLPVSNPNSGAWNFLAELGVMIEANLSTFIKLLLQLQRTECDDLSLTVEMYKQLNARFDEDSNAVCAAFKDNPLIYVPSVNTNGRGSWIAFQDAYWDGPPSMTSKVALKHSYLTLEDFFHAKLCMQNAPLRVLIDEFKSLAVEWNNEILTDDVATNVDDKLLDITDCLVQDPSVASTLSDIAELPIFPVRQPGMSSKRVLRRIHEFYVPDQAGKYAKQFEDEVPLLAVSRKLSVVSIQPLLDCHTWKQPAQYLEKCISAQTFAHGTRRVDMPVTQEYICRLEYLERELYHKRSSRIPADQMEFLQKMDNLTIEIVGSISSRLTLEDHVVQSDSARSSIQEDADRVSILVVQASASNERKRNHQVCSRLAERLDLDGMRLQQLFGTPVDELWELLDEQGVFAIPPEAERIRKPFWLATNTMTSDPPLTSLRRVAEPDETESRMEPPPTPAHVPPHARNPVKRKCEKFDDLEKNIRDLRMKLSSSSKFTQGEVRTPGSSPRPVQTAREIARFMSAPVGLVKPALSPGKESSARAVTAVAPSTASDRVNGILGELYVYELLRELIGLDFDEENWTSELRGEVHDLAPFSGDALADFRYKDSSGILTGLWYGEKTRTAWAGMWPTYHLEVKTTSGSARERFHVSQRQMDAAQHLTNRADSSGIAPTDVYVIIFVTGIRSATPSHMVFLDPHRCICHGDLSIKSDVYLSL